MAEKAAPKKKMIDVVADEEIWRSHVAKENNVSRSKWPKNWGYLLGEYNKMHNELKGIKGDDSVVDMEPAPKLPVIPKANKKFPKTTMKEIGWKSTKNGKNSDMVNRYSYGEPKYGQTTLTKVFKWPIDMA